MYKQLTSEQRYYIYLEKQRGSTQKKIAESIGVSESTVSRELRRNGGRGGRYNFIKAHERAMSRRHRSPGNRAKPPELLWRVRQLILEQQWSPCQISGSIWYFPPCRVVFGCRCCMVLCKFEDDVGMSHPDAVAIGQADGIARL